MANGFDLYGGGFMPMETPTYGGGLLQPPTPPQPQGLGLLPLIVGALGSAADPSFGKNFLYGLQMRQGQADNTYRNQLAQYRAQQQGQMFDLRRQEMQRKAEEAAAAQQQAQQQVQANIQAILASNPGMSEDQAAFIANNPEMMKRYAEAQYREDPAQWSAPFKMDLGRGLQLVQENTRTGAIKPIGQGPMVQNIVGAGPQLRGTPGGGTAALMRDPQTGQYQVQEVIPGRAPESQTKAQREAEAAAKADAELDQALKDYEATASPMTGPVKRDDVDRQRRVLAEKMARKLEPTGKLTDDDIKRQEANIPDVLGPYDYATAKERLDALRRTMGVTGGTQGDARSDDDILKQYGVN